MSGSVLILLSPPVGHGTGVEAGCEPGGHGSGRRSIASGVPAEYSGDVGAARLLQGSELLYWETMLRATEARSKDRGG